jgi:hypothetical protein
MSTKKSASSGSGATATAKRKAGPISADQSVAEKIKKTREWLSEPMIKKRLPNLKRTLKNYEKKLNSKKWTREDISKIRDCKETYDKLATEIKDLESGSKLIAFNAFVDTLDIDSLQKTNSEEKMVLRPAEDGGGNDNDNDINGLPLKLSCLGIPIDSGTQGMTEGGVMLQRADGRVFEQFERKELEGDLFVEEIEGEKRSNITHDGAASSSTTISPLHVSSIRTMTYNPTKEVEDEETLFAQVKQRKLTKAAVATKPESYFRSFDKIPLRKIDEYIEAIVDHSTMVQRNAGGQFCTDTSCQQSLVHSDEEGKLICTTCGSYRRHSDHAVNAAQSYFNTNRSTGSGTGRNFSTQFDVILGFFDLENWVKIPPLIIYAIKREVKMSDHHSTCISALRIREILRKYRLRNFYGNVVQIYSILNCRIPPTMTKEIKSAFQQTFRMLKIPYEKHKGDRKNFLSYPFTFKKLCEHLGYKQFIPFLDTVKSGESIRTQERIFHNICLDLGWVTD